MGITRFYRVLLILDFLETGEAKKEREGKRQEMRELGCLMLSAFVSAGGENLG